MLQTHWIVQVRNPTNKVMYEIIGGVDDEFVVVADVAGEYTMCFENLASSPTSKDEKHVSFNVHLGSEEFLKQAASIKDAEVGLPAAAVDNMRVCLPCGGTPNPELDVFSRVCDSLVAALS